MQNYLIPYNRSTTLNIQTTHGTRLSFPTINPKVTVEEFIKLASDDDRIISIVPAQSISNLSTICPSMCFKVIMTYISCNITVRTHSDIIHRKIKFSKDDFIQSPLALRREFGSGLMWVDNKPSEFMDQAAHLSEHSKLEYRCY